MVNDASLKQETCRVTASANIDTCVTSNTEVNQQPCSCATSQTVPSVKKAEVIMKDRRECDLMTPTEGGVNHQRLQLAATLPKTGPTLPAGCQRDILHTCDRAQSTKPLCRALSAEPSEILKSKKRHSFPDDSRKRRKLVRRNAQSVPSESDELANDNIQNLLVHFFQNQEIQNERMQGIETDLQSFTMSTSSTL